MIRRPLLQSKVRKQENLLHLLQMRDVLPN